MAVPERTPVERLMSEIDSRHPDSAHFLLEHLAHYGPEGLDVQELAKRVTEMFDEDDDELWDEEAGG